MNSIRIIGLLMVVLGIFLHFSFENEGINFLTGLLVGGGVALLITGRIVPLKK